MYGPLMFSRSFRIARIGGVDVNIDPGWVFLALLVVWSFNFEFSLQERSAGTTLVMAIAATLLFFGSLLAHELAHALEGIHRDIEVHGITLMVFGGVTEMTVSPRRPRDEFAISAVGPYVSLVAGALFGLVATVSTAVEGPPAVAEVAGTVGWLNVFLAAFNLVPGAPLDGGRVLRSAIWAATRDRHKAVRWASYAGQTVAGLLLLLALRLFVVQPDALVTALWAAAIGWFMWQAARAERRQAEVEALLEGRTMAALTAVEPPRLPADRTLDNVVDVLAAAPGLEVFPVVEPGTTGAGEPGGAGLAARSRVIGTLRLADVMAVDPHDRPFRSVSDLMRPIADLHQVREDDDLLEVAAAMSDGESVVVVDESGTPRALVTPGQVRAAIDRWHALDHPRDRRLPGRRGEAGPRRRGGER